MTPYTRYKLLLFRFLLSTILVAAGSYAFAQAYIAQRKTVNYQKEQYNAGTQNWKIRQDTQGRMFFANNEGVLTFDGANWQLFPLPNRTIVRSLEFGRDHKLYVGGQDEIGYFSPGKNAALVFTSLKELIPVTDRVFSDLWDIVAYGDDMFFRSNNKLFKYSKGKMTVYNSESWAFMGTAQGKLLAQDEQKGLLEYRNNSWQPLMSKKELPAGCYITSISPYNNASSLVTTVRNGVFLLNGKTMRTFNLRGFNIDNHQHFSAATALDDGTFLLSTYQNGIYQVDPTGLIMENITKKEGLQNTFVRSIYTDASHNVWLGLDNGIDYIAYNNAVKHISPAIFKDGSGYAAVLHHNSLYFALSNGIYQVPLTDIGDLSTLKNNFQTVAGGQTWNIAAVNGHLLAGREEDMLEIKEGKISQVSRATGFWIFKPLHLPGSKALIAAGNYYGVRLFEDTGTGYTDKGNLGKYRESARFLQVDSTNTIWTSHPYRGIYRITPGSGALKNYNINNGLPSTFNNFVFKVKEKIVVATEKGIYEYDRTTDRFKPSQRFAKIFGTRGIRYLQEDPAGNIWFVEGKTLGVVDYSSRPAIINFPELNNRILSGFENVYPINNENIFVGAENGFYHINYAKYKQNIRPLEVYIRGVRSASGTDSVLFGGYSLLIPNKNKRSAYAIPHLDHAFNSLHFEYSSPVFEEQSNVEYSYMLEGFDKTWSEWSKKTDKDYTNLPSGTYSFKVKARNHHNNESEVGTYAFYMNPPWYQTSWAYGFYIIVIASTLYLFYKQQEQRHLLKQAKELQLQQQKNDQEQRQQAHLHQLELERSDKELVNLKNEKLQAEIEHKTSELASSALNLVQQKEFLAKVRDELQRLQQTGKDNVEVAEIKKIQRMLTKEDKLGEQWQQFFIHFDKVHAGFLSMVKERYPSINQQELKLCAYLVMNLSSKEIAQLMAISVRGVEISRYRLRKKLQIPTEMNLFEFLFKIRQELMK